jgi:hypothetical protein
MIEKLTKTDIGILIAAAVMAFGAFCPLIKLPIVGSLNYFMNGRGDGIFVVGCSAAIVACVTFGYRRTAGLSQSIHESATSLRQTRLIKLAIEPALSVFRFRGVPHRVEAIEYLQLRHGHAQQSCDFVKTVVQCGDAPAQG